MKNTWELLKKIGAGIIIILLILMLAITFSSQPIEEILALLSGSSKAGTFNNEPILVKDYSFIYNECENQFQRYGLTEVPPYLLQNCIFENIQNLYVKPVIANDLGLNISKESIENQILDYVTEIHRIQKKNNLPEDVIPLHELYQRELAAIPLKKRIAFLQASLVDQFLLKPIAISNKDWEVLESLAKDNLMLNIDIIAFTNQDLLNQITVDVSKEEILNQYEEDKKEFYSKIENKDKKYPLIEERYKFLKEKIENEKKRKMLSTLKDKLSELNKNQINSLEEIQKIVLIPSTNKIVSLKQLDALVINNKKVNLLNNDFISAILNQNKNILGPIQDKENTIYVKLNNIIIKNNNIKVDLNKQNIEERLAYVFYDYILDQYRKRGNFQLYDLMNNKEKKNKH
jgi:hypothetical protein